MIGKPPDKDKDEIFKPFVLQENDESVDKWTGEGHYPKNHIHQPRFKQKETKIYRMPDKAKKGWSSIENSKSSSEF